MEAVQSSDPPRLEFRSSMQGSAILPKKRMVRMALDEQMANEARASSEEKKSGSTSSEKPVAGPRSNNPVPESVPIPIEDKPNAINLALGPNERGMEMDECAAAMVLMSLSCSPRSPTNGWAMNPGANRDASSAWSDRLSPASTTSSSGVASYNADIIPSPPFAGAMHHPSHHEESYGGHQGHHQPHFHLHNHHSGRYLQPVDEGILMDSGGLDLDVSPKEESRIGYKCTWKGCGFLTLACAEVERHIRDVHLGPRNEDSEEDSDNEVEFYYTEVEVSPGDLQPPSMEESVDSWPQPSASNLDTQQYHCQHEQPHHHQQEGSVIIGSVQEHHSYLDSQTGPFHGSMYASSAPVISHMEMAGHMHGLDLRQQDQQFVMVGGHHVPKSSAVPISMPQRGGSWHPYGGSPMSPHKFSRFSPKTGSSPKITGLSRPRRTESKKCRKVYGVDHKDMWCTQCKWKKACTRFNE